MRQGKPLQWYFLIIRTQIYVGEDLNLSGWVVHLLPYPTELGSLLFRVISQGQPSHPPWRLHLGTILDGRVMRLVGDWVRCDLSGGINVKVESPQPSLLFLCLSSLHPSVCRDSPVGHRPRTHAGEDRDPLIHDTGVSEVVECMGIVVRSGVLCCLCLLAAMLLLVLLGLSSYFSFTHPRREVVQLMRYDGCNKVALVGV
jgi:hypothetical protein